MSDPPNSVLCAHSYVLHARRIRLIHTCYIHFTRVVYFNALIYTPVLAALCIPFASDSFTRVTCTSLVHKTVTNSIISVTNSIIIHTCRIHFARSHALMHTRSFIGVTYTWQQTHSYVLYTHTCQIRLTHSYVLMGIRAITKPPEYGLNYSFFKDYFCMLDVCV